MYALRMDIGKNGKSAFEDKILKAAFFNESRKYFSKSPNLRFEEADISPDVGPTVLIRAKARAINFDEGWEKQNWLGKNSPN